MLYWNKYCISLLFLFYYFMPWLFIDKINDTMTQRQKSNKQKYLIYSIVKIMCSDIQVCGYDISFLAIQSEQKEK